MSPGTTEYIRKVGGWGGVEGGMEVGEVGDYVPVVMLSPPE